MLSSGGRIHNERLFNPGHAGPAGNRRAETGGRPPQAMLDPAVPSGCKRGMRGGEIVIAGAGAIGRAVALALARAGHRVTVIDPSSVNASSVAAGMLAPAFESVFDAGAAGGYPLLAGARDLWPALAADIGLPLARDGALAIGSQADAEGWAAQLAGAGAATRLLAPGALAVVEAAAPAGAWAAFTPEDWRLAPREALARLRAAAELHGARFLSGSVLGFQHGHVDIVGDEAAGERLPADRLVIATGAGRDLQGLAPELEVLTPIKGHICRMEGAFVSEPTVRANGVYVCRGDGEAVIGATMEVGVASAGVDPDVAVRLLEAAEAALGGGLLAPRALGLGLGAWRAAAGVRAATPDGLPLVGPSETVDVVLAVGARRNGWLLAPMIAQAVLDAVEGRAPSAVGATFAPRRLS